ncbi:MAG TPA: SDR family NAD(P)-dependent oxidoreductase, partial [Clostridia bacterium]|nr:SDR family NAD(P)-dependent oxidoreductase [Clostridia bacterium]
MRIEAGQTVFLTGASGGLGAFIARAFAKRKVNLALVAYPGTGLEALRDEVVALGVRADIWAADLRQPEARRTAVEEVTRNLGPVDVLINNAGVEFCSPYHELTEEQISEVIGVNLEAAMLLTRLVLPGMLERRRGHIVNMSSLAGKSGPAFQEAYAATKAALVGFTASLRASYRDTGVSASVIVPGFVEAGIYERLKAKSGVAAPFVLTGSTPDQVAAAILRAIDRNSAEIIVNRYPIRPMLALTAISP